MERILSLLAEKERLFLEFEGYTVQMLSCEAERLEELLAGRAQVIERVDALDEQLGALCGRDAPVVRAMGGDCNPDELENRLQPVYHAAMAVRSVVCRLPELDVQAAMRLRLEQEMILDRIKQSNKGAGAKAARFYSARSNGPSRSEKV